MPLVFYKYDLFFDVINDKRTFTTDLYIVDDIAIVI